MCHMGLTVQQSATSIGKVPVLSSLSVHASLCVCDCKREQIVTPRGLYIGSVAPPGLYIGTSWDIYRLCLPARAVFAT
jgi:hypothetical protein